MATQQDRAPLILHVPYTYYPDPIGSTEVYVQGLARELVWLGYDCAVAAPGDTPGAYEVDQIPVRRFTTDKRKRLELAYGMPDILAAKGFGEIIEMLQPSIVHLHAKTAAISRLLVQRAKAAGIRVVLTYHTPTVSCARGDMMELGFGPCDGKITKRRCVSCGLQKHGTPQWLADMVARLPWAGTVGLAGSALPAPLRVPGLIAAHGETTLRLFDEVDHVVAVCDWVGRVLLANGIDARRLTLSRQGVGTIASPPSNSPPNEGNAPLRLAYFGRIEFTKGPDLLVAALAQLPAAAITLDIFAIRQSASDLYSEGLIAATRRDGRINMRTAVPVSEVQGAMSQYDFVCVPSRWLETGPLVVLEAFAAGVPVLGTDRGGLAELVRHQIDGLLVPDTSVSAWAQTIALILEDRPLAGRLRAGIRPSRTMADAAADMAQLYGQLGVTPARSATTTPEGDRQPS